jgi:hypothetical protein
MLRTASWLAYGVRWFTAAGYERSAKGFDSSDEVRAFMLVLRRRRR